MNDLEIIRNKIYEIRGQRVMLDRDLADLYGVETRALNQAVKRNIERFPEDFMFQLTKGELEIVKSHIVMTESFDYEMDKDWKSQIVTSNSIKMGLRKMPFAFTELGVAMLSSVLKSPLAIQTNINIMRAFVSFRKVVSLVSKEDLADMKKEIVAYIDEILEDQNDINEENRAQLDAISEALVQLQSDSKQPHRPVILGFSKPSDKK